MPLDLVKEGTARGRFLTSTTLIFSPLLDLCAFGLDLDLDLNGGDRKSDSVLDLLI